MTVIHVSAMLWLAAIAVVCAAASHRADVRREKWQPADANLGPNAYVTDSMMQIAQPGPQGTGHRSIASNFVLRRVDDPEMESDGRIAAWIAPDGRMMIPPKSRRPISHANDVPEDLRLLGLPEDSLVGDAVRESLSRGSGTEHPAGGSAGRYGIPLPYATYANGSDIFLHDIYAVHPDFDVATSLCSQSAQYPGCYFTDAPNCTTQMVCTSTTSFMSHSFPLPTDLLSFEMNETEMTVVSSKAFESINLVSMRLAANRIRMVHADAFAGTSGLIYLSLESNLIQHLDFGLAFRGLNFLVVLLLKDNRLNFTYIGTVEPNDEPVLPALVYLNLANNPLGVLNQYTFASLRNSSLEELNLQSCSLRSIHSGAFDWFPKLIHVDLYNNPELMSLVLRPSPNQSPFYIPPVKQLGLAFNQLDAVPNSILNTVNASLTVLNLSSNSFFRLMENFFPSLPLLNTLILESCNINSIDDGAFDTLPSLLYLYLGRNKLTQIGWNVLPSNIRLLSIRNNPSDLYGPDQKFRLDDLSGLTNLFWLDMNDMNLESVNQSVFSGLTKLQTLQLRNSGIAEIEPSTFQSLEQLLLLDLGENRQIHTLPERFSEGLHSVRLLYLDHCSISFPEEPLDDASKSPFAHMTALAMMYLAENNIHHFHGPLIANNSLLTILDVSGNQMSTWHLNTTHMLANDSRVSVSNNRITHLPEGFADEFALVEKVDLSSNALLCNCQVKDLLLLAERNALIGWEDLDAYKCTDTSSSPVVVRRIQNMSEVDFQCDRQPQPTTESIDANPPESTVSYVAGAICAVVVISAASGYCYIKRRQLAHVWFTYRHQVEPTKLMDQSPASYEYDAFISFNASDRQWVYEQLVAQLEGTTSHRSGGKGSNATGSESHQPRFRLCVHDRDFTPGRMITENIVSNICKSRHVIIVLSKAYCESKWCRYELNLAHHQLMDENRNTLVLILLEDVPKSSQYSCLRYVMRTRTYMVWNSDIEGQNLFWRRLTALLTGQETTRPS